MFSDSVDYLIVADFYRQSFGGEVGESLRHQYASTRFPPLYPLLLAMVGAGVNSTFPAFVLEAALLLACAALVAWWYIRETGSTSTALALLPLGVITPQLVTWFVLPLSEPLFMLLLSSILLAANLHSRNSLDVLVVALLVALLPFSRSAGIAITAGFLLWLTAAPGLSRNRRIAAACTALAPVLIWSVYRSTLPVVLAYGDQLSMSQIIAQHGSLTAFLADQAIAIVRGWQSWMDPYLSSWTIVPAIALATLAIVGWWLRFRAWKLDALFLPIYFGMILVWPFPAEMPRLVGVMAPVLAICAWDGASLIWSTASRTHARPASVLLVTAIAGVGLGGSVGAWSELAYRATADAPTDVLRYKRWQGYLLAPNRTTAAASLETMGHILGMMEALPRTIPSSDCVYTQFSSFVWVQTQGAVRSRNLQTVDPARPIQEQLSDCNYILALNLTSPQHGTEPLYPLALIQDHVQPLLRSKFDVPEGEILAAALMRIQRDAPESGE